MSKKTKKYFGKVTYDVDPYKAVAEGDMTLVSDTKQNFEMIVMYSCVHLSTVEIFTGGG